MRQPLFIYCKVSGMLKSNLLLFLKGIAMGAANVIPGVSGGTIAFITNIYEELIHSLKSFDVEAIQLFFTFRFKTLADHVNLTFLIFLFSGVFISILSLGKILAYLFEFYPVYIWAFFFGLILASIYFVGKSVSRWQTRSLIFLITGAVIAILITYLNPASENENMLYLFLCGIVAMISMLLPGLSGSFVLILMGNYKLIFLEAVPALNMAILIPVALGSIVGFVILSRVISYLLDRLRNETISLLTGFILGSLLIIWPWKETIYLKNAAGELLLKNGKMIIEGYNWFFPDLSNLSTWIAVLYIIAGMALVIFIEKMAIIRETS